MLAGRVNGCIHGAKHNSLPGRTSSFSNTSIRGSLFDLPGEDLTGEDLTGEDLTGEDLTGIGPVDRAFFTITQSSSRTDTF